MDVSVTITEKLACHSSIICPGEAKAYASPLIQPLGSRPHRSIPHNLPGHARLRHDVAYICWEVGNSDLGPPVLGAVATTR